MSTEAIDAAIHDATRARGAISAPYLYPPGSPHPFPKHCCTSVNEVVCHGIPDPNRILHEGDIINVDVTPRLDGYHGDTSRTYFVGDVSRETRRLVDVTFEAAVEVMTKIRGAKTLGQKSLRWPVASLEIVGPEAGRNALAPVMDDILRAGNVVDGGLSLADGESPEGERFAITITLGEEEAS